MKKILIIFCCFYSINLSAQILDKLKPTIFTLQNAKISIGFNMAANFANGKSESFMNQFKGSLPDEVAIRFDTTQGLPNLSAGLSFDIFSPNSNIGFLAGVEYNRLTFQLTEQETSTNYFEVSKINFPVYLKWKFGKVHARGNVFLAAGGVYSIPIAYSRENNLEEVDDKGELDNTFSLSSMLGYQFRFVSKEDLTSNTNSNGVVKREYTRGWFFLRADYALDNTFNTSTSNRILPLYSNAEIDYKNLAFTIGVAVFFGFK